jgi:LAO/AO transport system kinase
VFLLVLNAFIRLITSKFQVPRIELNKIETMLSSTRILAEGLVQKKRDCLARAITLIESSNRNHSEQAAYLLDYIIKNRDPYLRQDGIRIGIAGPPGAGKSTFIEKLGLRYVNQSHKVAVIPVDPSSHISGGSILGDKTRMGDLSKSMNAYIRASPTRGMLGGIAEHTSDVILLCESAGFDTVIVESVGLGQSEVDIDSAVDILILIVPPGGGDSLQATKKGIMEAADLILVNKADGDLLSAAKHTRADYGGAMQFVRRKYMSWEVPVMMMSAHTGFQLDQVEEQINNFKITLDKEGLIEKKRIEQRRFWAMGQFRRSLFAKCESIPGMKEEMERVMKELDNGRHTPRTAALTLIDKILMTMK